MDYCRGGLLRTGTYSCGTSRWSVNTWVFYCQVPFICVVFGPGVSFQKGQGQDSFRILRCYNKISPSRLWLSPFLWLSRMTQRGFFRLKCIKPLEIMGLTINLNWLLWQDFFQQLSPGNRTKNLVVHWMSLDVFFPFSLSREAAKPLREWFVNWCESARFPFRFSLEDLEDFRDWNRGKTSV